MILSVKFKACPLTSSRPFAGGLPSSTPRHGTGNSRPTSMMENSMPWVNARAKPTPLGSPRRFESLRFAGVLGLLPSLAGSSAVTRGQIVCSAALQRTPSFAPAQTSRRVFLGARWAALSCSGIDVKDGVSWFWIARTPITTRSSASLPVSRKRARSERGRAAQTIPLHPPRTQPCRPAPPPA